MSTKKETERSSTLYDDKREVRAGLSEQNHAVDRALDETRDNITKTINEFLMHIQISILRNTASTLIRGPHLQNSVLEALAESAT